MTIPYNSKEYGISQKLEEEFSDKIFVSNSLYTQLKSGLIELSELINLSENESNLNKKKKSSDQLKEKINSEKKEGIFIFIPKTVIKKDPDDQTLYFTSKELYQIASIIRQTVLNIIPPFDNLNKYFDLIIKFTYFLKYSCWYESLYEY